jgi:hypothetical protein
MKNNVFTLGFISTFSILILAFAALLIIVDPKQTIEFRSDNSFERYHENFILKKRQQMKKGNKDFDTIILGSSTSEAFYPVDVDFYLNAKSFSAASGGGQTPIRYSFLQAALEDYPNLSRVIYVVDLFEFNHNLTPGDFLYNSEMKRLSSSLNLKRSPMGFARYHFSNQFIESSINVIKRRKSNVETTIHSDGTTSRSMILSPLDPDISVTIDLNSEQKKNLMIQVDENYHTYSTRVLNNFHELNSDVLKIFDMINSLTLSKDIEVIYILAPYQYDFKMKLMELDDLSILFKDWRTLFENFAAQQENITVVDMFDDKISKNPNSSVWRDGIHFSRGAAISILKSIGLHQ